MGLIGLPFFLTLAIYFFNPQVIHANEIPAFTSNVIDPLGHLSAQQSSSILQTLEVIRHKADIYGAVFIVDHLEGDTIETLAERAFKKWKLGRNDIDNGLLLVISVKDRKSRFEVGYGLEGDLPDVYAKEALDLYFRPAARNNNFDEAIISSFNFLASKKIKRPILDRPLPQTTQTTPKLISKSQSSAYNNLHQRRTIPEGLLVSFLLVFFLFALRPFTVCKILPRAVRLSREIEGYQISEDPFIKGATVNFWKNFFSGNVIFKIILALVLGFTLVTFWIMDPIFFLHIYTVALACNILLIVINIMKYRSTSTYRDWLVWERDSKLRMARNPFPHSNSWSPSSDSWASSSSDFSSSSSSSSDGGSSGGGGASSDW